MGLYGVCDWNEFGTFYYVSGFAGYLVLAFYLVKFPPAWNWRRTLASASRPFIAGYLVTGLGYVVMQKHFPGNYAYLEIVWYFAGINVFMMTAPVFILVRKAAAPRMALAAGRRDVRHLSLPLHLRSGRLRPRAADSGTSDAGAHPADRMPRLRRREPGRWCG